MSEIKGTAQIERRPSGMWYLTINILGEEEPAICCLGHGTILSTMACANRLVERLTHLCAQLWEPAETEENLWSTLLASDPIPMD